MTATAWVAVGAALALVVGLVLALLGRGMRQRRGLGGGKTVSLDRVTLTSRRVWPSHRAQMGCYFLLVEDRLGVRPTHGFIVCGDGTRHRIENTEELRAWVLDLAGRIRAARARVGDVIAVIPRPGQCRVCGQRGNCGQARL